ncbi:hypothetical protein C1645_840236 [Glomus cerebriforme]|uniref:Uncharacterized protein n=1 Tax=Glomus cerebriforme TaxID=658196 RepID=A0A397SBC2_9GLOM|nr:hypothetical protein C1645_840236 [Glomus cerebriforme]
MLSLERYHNIDKKVKYNTPNPRSIYVPPVRLAFDVPLILDQNSLRNSIYFGIGFCSFNDSGLRFLDNGMFWASVREYRDGFLDIRVPVSILE